MRRTTRTGTKLLPYLPIAIQEVPPEFPGVHHRLSYSMGEDQRGLLDLARDTWEQESSRQRTLIETHRRDGAAHAPHLANNETAHGKSTRRASQAVQQGGSGPRIPTRGPSHDSSPHYGVQIPGQVARAVRSGRKGRAGELPGETAGQTTWDEFITSTSSSDGKFPCPLPRVLACRQKPP